LLDDDALGSVDLAFENAPGEIEWRTAGAGGDAFGTVDSPTGNFDHALIVEATAHFDLLITARHQGQNRTLPAVLELRAALWFVPDVGLVYQKFTSSQIIALGYSYPIRIVSDMILSGYNFSPSSGAPMTKVPASPAVGHRSVE